MIERPRRHSWSDKVAYEHHSDRVCWDCALIRRTRHEPDSNPQHWIEWWRDGRRIQSDHTPPCPGPKPVQQPAEAKGEEHASHH